MKKCEICLMNSLPEAEAGEGTVKAWVERPFTEANSRYVFMCRECYQQWIETSDEWDCEDVIPNSTL